MRYALVVLGWLLTAVVTDAGEPFGELELIAEVPLPDAIEWAMDVRWHSDDAVLIAAGQAGVWQVPVNSPDVKSHAVIPGGRGAGKIWMASRLGYSDTHLATAPPALTLAWRTSDRMYQEEFAVVVDLDVSGDRVAVLGAQRDRQGRFAADGAIAWQGRLATDLRDLKPVTYALAGAGAQPMADCWTLEPGAIRFLSDGSLIVVPGVEPGVFWYDSSGQLQRAWESERVGLEGETCSRDRDDLASNPEAQFAWTNQRTTLDDILPLSIGPGLVLRQRSENVTRWRLQVLSQNGDVLPATIPVTSPTGRGHLRGDVRGDRVVLLLSQYGIGKPAARPRLMLFEGAP